MKGLIKTEENKKIAKNIFWNTFGSLFYCACTWLLSVVVVRVSATTGYEDAGVLSLALSVTNIFATIAFFNVRNYQVSDSEGEYTNSEYHTHRLFTCLGAMVLCIAFVVINSYSLYVSLSIVFYMVVKVVEAYADVLHGMAQNEWRLDIAGKGYIIRGALIISTFTVFQYLFSNLAVSIFAMAVSNVIALFLYDVFAVRKIEKFNFEPSRKKLFKLTKQCLPLLVYGVCTNAIVSAARYFIDMFHGEKVLGYYATVASIALIVQVCLTIVFTPLIGVFNESYHKNDKKSIAVLFGKLVGLLVVIAAVAALAFFFFGEPVMVFIFGEEIREYVYLLYPIVIASCLTALIWLLGIMLVIMRDEKTLMFTAIFGFVLCIVLSLCLIPSEPYKGANISIIVSLAAISAVYLIRFFVYLFTRKKNEEVSNV